LHYVVNHRGWELLPLGCSSEEEEESVMSEQVPWSCDEWAAEDIEMARFAITDG